MDTVVITEYRVGDAIDQTCRNGPQVAGHEHECVARGVFEHEGACEEARPVATRDSPGFGMPAHGKAWRGRDVDARDAGQERTARRLRLWNRQLPRDRRTAGYHADDQPRHRENRVHCHVTSAL